MFISVPNFAEKYVTNIAERRKIEDSASILAYVIKDEKMPLRKLVISA
ncbi:hypothetical protein AB4259_13665 [Vibrio amylolyticus]